MTAKSRVERSANVGYRRLQKSICEAWSAAHSGGRVERERAGPDAQGLPAGRAYVNDATGTCTLR